MKKVVASAAVLAVSLGQALAADLPSVKASPAAPIPMFNWTGFYFGVNGGFGGGANTADLVLLGPSFGGVTPVTTGDVTVGYGDFFGGGQVGYNYQFPNRYVIGVESDFQWSGAQFRGDVNTTTIVGPAVVSNAGSAQVGQNWFGTTRVRLGYAFSDRFLPYITGGLAYSELAGNLRDTAVLNLGLIALAQGSNQTTSVGWTLGAGLEYALTDSVSFKTEYLYQNYSGLSMPFNVSVAGLGVGALGMGTLTQRDHEVHSVRAGVNWKLDSFGAPVAVAATAAGLPMLKGPSISPALPAFPWTGFYVGVNGGYGGGTNTAGLSVLGPAFPAAPVPITTGTVTVGYGDFSAGGQVGYNFELPNRMVLGLESDFQWSGVQFQDYARTTTTAAGAVITSNSTAQAGQNWYGTTRARLGYATFDRLLPFISGGVAYSELTGNLQNSTPTKSRRLGAGEGQQPADLGRLDDRRRP